MRVEGDSRMDKNKKLHKILLIFTLFILGMELTERQTIEAAEAMEFSSEKKEYIVFSEQSLKQFARDDSRPTDQKEVHLSNGDKIEYLAEAANNYFKVRVGGVEGYIKRNYVTSPANYEKLVQAEKFEISEVAVEREKNTREEYTIVSDAVVRTRDLPHAGPVLLLQRGDKVQYLGSTKNRYFKVEVQGQEGYVFRGDLTADLEKATTNFIQVPVKQENIKDLQAVVNTNIRNRANKESAPAAGLKKEETVQYLGTVIRDENWFMVKNQKGIRGYIQRGELTSSKSRLAYEERIEKEAIKYQTIYRDDFTLAQGQTKIQTAGKNGEIKKTYLLTYQDGELISESLTSEVALRAPVNEIILVGRRTTPLEFEVSSFDTDLFNEEFLSLVNAERRRMGVSTLRYNKALQKGVNIRLDENCGAYNISHTRPNGESFCTAFNYLYKKPVYYLGENLAYHSVSRAVEADVNAGKTTFERGYAELFYDMYVESPAHYQNMIKPGYKTMAVGLQDQDRRVFNVMIFSLRD